MTAEQRVLLDLLGQGVQSEKLNTVPEVTDWQALTREANAQAVFLPLFDVLSLLQGQMPEEVYQDYFRRARRATALNMRAEYAQAELVQLLEQMGCPYVILKGEVAAADYPEPHLRQLGDVDFMVPTEHTGEVVEKMTALGYVHSWEPGDYHQVLNKNSACLEMHMEVAGLPKGKHRQVIQAYLSDIFEKRRSLDLGFGPFCAPCEEHHGLILILHMQHHVLEKGMGLRHIMDWACYVNSTAEKPFWQEQLLPILRQTGLLRFAAVMTKMASLYLGSCCPEWAAEAEESLCRALMEDILTSGNFGRKDENRSRSVNMLPDWEKNEKKAGKIRLLYRTLRGSVLRNHPQWEKKPVRLFFCMTGKAVRYAVLFIQGKRPNLLKAAAYADVRRSVYEQLRLFETEESIEL